MQFLAAVDELARGAPVPSVRPVWGRELLEVRNPPRPVFAHREYDEVLDTKGTIMPPSDMVHRSFFFGAGMSPPSGLTARGASGSTPPRLRSLRVACGSAAPRL